MFNCTLIFITNIKFIQLLFLLFLNLSAIIIHVMVTQPFYFASFVWFVLEPEGCQHPLLFSWIPFSCIISSCSQTHPRRYRVIFERYRISIATLFEVWKTFVKLCWISSCFFSSIWLPIPPFVCMKCYLIQSKDLLHS